MAGRLNILLCVVFMTGWTFHARRCAGQVACNRPVGPDVIVSDIPETTSYGSVGGISAFAIGTTSCNVGNENLQWVGTTNQHPVIAQNMYQLHDGRIRQIGMSWLKHGFVAFSQNLCDCGCNGEGGNVLGVGCSDPYSSGLNGFQGSGGTGGLGPRYEVNPHTGVFPFPYAFQGVTGDDIFKRLQVHNSDLDPNENGGGTYFVEAQYVTPDDAAAGNQNNNASYRQVGISLMDDIWTASVQMETLPEMPAISAWKLADPSVVETSVQVPDDGLLILAGNATPQANGRYRYEYALYNMNSDRAVRSFSVPSAIGATFANVGFHDVDHHSGDGIGGVTFDGTDWANDVADDAISWSTDSFAQNPNANAIRWGTMYNFYFESDLVPATTTGPVTLGLFKPGTPDSVAAPSVVPSATIAGVTIMLPEGPPAYLPPDAALDFDVRIVSVTQALLPGSATLDYRYDGGAFVTAPLVPLGGDLFRATLPPAACDAMPEFYITAMGDGGTAARNPLAAPGDVYAPVMGDDVVELADDFETDKGWTVENDSIVTGAWERGMPAGGGDRRDPPADYDGSGQCYVTGNMDGDDDVDGGPTRLVSPLIDLSAAIDPIVEYARWYSSDGFGSDPLQLEVSDDGGGSWVYVEGAYFGTNWELRSFRLRDYVEATSQVRLRFSVQDTPDNSVTEAAIDSVLVRDFRCVTVCNKGDVNGDTLRDGRDVDAFVRVLTAGDGTALEVCAGDLHLPFDGQVTMDDVNEFVACLLSGSCGS